MKNDPAPERSWSWQLVNNRPQFRRGIVRRPKNTNDDGEVGTWILQFYEKLINLSGSPFQNMVGRRYCRNSEQFFECICISFIILKV